MAGGQIEGASLLFIGWFFVVNALVLFFPGVDIVTLGVILVLVEAIGSSLIKSLFGYPGIIAFLSSIFTVLARIIYFMTLGGILELMFQYI